jgi:hypothetical protein
VTHKVLLPVVLIILNGAIAAYSQTDPADRTSAAREHYALARKYYAVGEPVKGLQELREATQLDPPILSSGRP